MTVETLSISISEIIIGIVVLIIGAIIYYFAPKFPRPGDIVAKIVGLIVAIIGIVMIILAFF